MALLAPLSQSALDYLSLRWRVVVVDPSQTVLPWPMRKDGRCDDSEEAPRWWQQQGSVRQPGRGDPPPRPADDTWPPHGVVSRWYRVPTLSFVGDARQCLPAMPKHGPWPWHQLVADWLAATWRRQAEAACAFSAATDAAAANMEGAAAARAGRWVLLPESNFRGPERPEFPRSPWLYVPRKAAGAPASVPSGSVASATASDGNGLGTTALLPPIPQLASSGAEFCTTPLSLLRADTSYHGDLRVRLTPSTARETPTAPAAPAGTWVGERIMAACVRFKSCLHIHFKFRIRRRVTPRA